MQLISHHTDRVNIARAERWISVAGGSILAMAGLRRRSPAGIAMIVGGAGLIRRGITGYCPAYKALGLRTAPKGQGAETTSLPYELGIRVDKSITIDKPRAEMFRFWRDFTNLPRFMDNVESVRPLDDNHSHWVVKGPAGRHMEWDAVIHNESENEMIAWRSLPGASVDNAGSVWFNDAPGGQGTEVKVELQYNPPAGALGAVVAGLWGKEPGMQIEHDLRQLKQVMEAGEVATTRGQPTVRAAARAAKKEKEREVEYASRESFPASDSPSFNQG
jgi:uncharacterized membrane protein